MKFVRDVSGRMLLAVILVALVLAFTGGAFVFLRTGHAEGGKENGAKADKPIEVVNWEFDEFTVNLADPGQSRYLRVNLVLEIEASSEGGKSKHGGPNPEEIKTRDAIITVITRKRYTDLLTEDGKTRLKSELISTLNETLHNTNVTNVYFTSFAMM